MTDLDATLISSWIPRTRPSSEPLERDFDGISYEAPSSAWMAWAYTRDPDAWWEWANKLRALGPSRLESMCPVTRMLDRCGREAHRRWRDGEADTKEAWEARWSQWRSRQMGTGHKAREIEARFGRMTVDGTPCTHGGSAAASESEEV